LTIVAICGSFTKIEKNRIDREVVLSTTSGIMKVS